MAEQFTWAEMVDAFNLASGFCDAYPAVIYLVDGKCPRCRQVIAGEVIDECPNCGFPKRS